MFKMVRSAEDSRRPKAGLSHVQGRQDSPLWRETIGEVFARTVARFATREAACFPEQDIRVSYDELSRDVDRLALGLLQLGLEKGDRIGIWAPNRYEWLLTQFATARLGLVMVNINPAYRLAELEYAINKVECRALILAECFKTSDYVGMIRELAPELNQGDPVGLKSARLPSLEFVIKMGTTPQTGMLSFADLLVEVTEQGHRRLEASSAVLNCEDPINIQFTSGTTGAPKGATLSHFNILNNARFSAEAMKFTEADRLCIPVPLYHCFGMVLGTLACVTCGASMVFPGQGFDPVVTLDAAAGEGCTALYGVPTMFIAMLDHESFGSHDFSRLRTGIMAGAPCPIEVMRRVVGDMNMAEVTIGYGMTETSPISFQSGTDDGIEDRVATVGRIHPHVEVKIIDDQGATVPVGTQGELCTRGYSVMHGYWNDEARTAETIDGQGWIHTGDLATLDARGFCNIVGRVKDMVIRGGENIYPREIEEFLYRDPRIAEVQVFGIPDQKYGEELCAWIVLQPGHTADAEDIKAFCEGQIAHFKIPRHIRFVDSLPMTVTGKPQKFVMRERMVAELGVEEIVTA